ncbi:N-acetyltransferase [Pelovirga terrestris]|uniref:N-acetyltransferase n=1 Tax=Pelovirga terrestris TaxID=2771352 RepID=A0A8J6UKG4_9BACT|nr:N-acetyltransferase [Pelovirga terrestris]MBD1399377.1 N-acetyltransferase [Pelovirga terrestris]
MIRPARIPDARIIHQLLLTYAKDGQLLGRSLAAIYDSIRDFYVYEEDGKILGIGALAICWADLAEVRSLAVVPGQHGKGIGRQIVERCLQEARELGLQRVFALTYQPEFFQKLGFTEIDKAQLPQKVWGDCINCVKFPDCDEFALAINILNA